MFSSREAAAEWDTPASAAASRLELFVLAQFLGLTPKAICCRRFATFESLVLAHAAGWCGWSLTRGGTPSDLPPSMAMQVPVTIAAASLAR